jgi:hypothetical protein
MPTLREYSFAEIQPDIRGTKVYDAKEEKLGVVDDVIFDRESGDLRYLIVDAGWLTAKHFIVPADQVFARGEEDDLHISMTKTEIKDLPAFGSEHLRSEEDFAAYESNYRKVWRQDVDRSKQHPHTLLERFRESLRKRFDEMKRRRVEPMPAGAEPRRPVLTGVARATGVYGVYAERADVERAVDALKELGFRNTDISVLFPDKDTSQKFAVQKSTKAPEGALAGGGTGLVIGGALGWLAGIGAIAIPGIGPLIAAGPIVTAVAGAGVGSAVGGVAGALIGLGVPELEAKRMESELRKGGILLSVHCDDQRFAESARKVLERTKAKDVFLTEEKRAA